MLRAARHLHRVIQIFVCVWRIDFSFSNFGNPGIHWFCVLRNDEGFEVFDSLGISKGFMQKHLPFFLKPKCSLTLDRVQPKTSDTCGQFCLYFLVNRLHNLDEPFDKFLLQCFVADKQKNNKKIVKFVRSVLKRAVSKIQ